MARVDIVVTTKGVQKADPTKPANEGQEASNPIEKLNTGTTENAAMTSIVANNLMNMGKQILSNVVDYRLSHYGDTTGNYLAQSNLNHSIEALKQMGGVVTAGVTGFLQGGPLMAVVNVGMQIGSLAIGNARDNKEYSIAMARTNASASFNASRMGYILEGGNR